MSTASGLNSIGNDHIKTLLPTCIFRHEEVSDSLDKKIMIMKVFWYCGCHHISFIQHIVLKGLVSVADFTLLRSSQFPEWMHIPASLKYIYLFASPTLQCTHIKCCNSDKFNLIMPASILLSFSLCVQMSWLHVQLLLLFSVRVAIRPPSPLIRRNFFAILLHTSVRRVRDACNIRYLLLYLCRFFNFKNFKRLRCDDMKLRPICRLPLSSRKPWLASCASNEAPGSFFFSNKR